MERTTQQRHGSPYLRLHAMVLFSFLLNGGRHLINDATIGLSLKPADLMSHVAVWGPFVLTAILWVALFATGRVSL